MDSCRHEVDIDALHGFEPNAIVVCRYSTVEPYLKIEVDVGIIDFECDMRQNLK